ncbi:hypothetical protein BpHYR1_011242, partial [Brachionus plicatilis]
TLTVTPQPQVKKKRGRPVGSNKQKKKIKKYICSLVHPSIEINLRNKWNKVGFNLYYSYTLRQACLRRRLTRKTSMTLELKVLIRYTIPYTKSICKWKKRAKLFPIRIYK